ncbi:heterogeneous nuclear ribonucleoprotein [Nesidiocoris tenuis]|uniref:Heterogeneous nuclear ribonucleoprotein n=1 Tax=Nesidiocoris tenuis TaxID=355587 RepID=A0ABN7B0S9_9HEMI|nr:heterogeneous nuclear ribonucleoprotein [Nesidiocoris tenuis]
MWDRYTFRKLRGVEIEAVKSFIVFRGALSQISVLFFNSQDELFGFGFNGRDYNILGVTGSSFRSETIDSPTKVELLSGKRITRMSTGIHVCAALDEQSNLYWWGQDLDQPKNVRLPEIVAPGHKFKAVSCGAQIMAALDSSGVVYIWGKDRQMWLLQVEHPVKHLSSGYYHIAMLAENGQVYTWGDGVEGQRGYEGYTKADNDLAKRMDLNQECTSVVCGTYNTMCLTVSGELWACGGNNMWCGCLGVPHDKMSVHIPEKVEVPGRVFIITATFHYSQQTIFAALTSEGLYWWCERPYTSRAPDPTIVRLLAVFESPHDQMFHVSESCNSRLSRLFDRCLIDIPDSLAEGVTSRLQRLIEDVSSSED